MLLESSARAGGLILTEHVDGFTIEAGADSMLVQKPAALQLCDELGLGPQLIAPASSTAYVFADGRLHALPRPSVFGIPITWSGLTAYDLLPWPAVCAWARWGQVLYFNISVQRAGCRAGAPGGVDDAMSRSRSFLPSAVRRRDGRLDRCAAHRRHPCG